MNRILYRSVIFFYLLFSTNISSSDDDYRLLKHDLFVRYGSESQTPLPSPASTTRHQQHLHQPSPAPPPPLPVSRKQSVISNVANLFRRATGRSPQPQLHQSRSHTPIPQRRTIRHKPSFLLSLRTDHQPQQQQQQHHPQPQPQPQHHPQPYQQPPPQQQLPEAQEQDDPYTLRATIASTEAEYARLREAFIALETSTLKRIEYKTARRLYTPTPTNVNVLFEGREWRKHTRPVPSIVLPPPTTSSHSHLSRTPSTTDQQSIHSTTSSSRLSVTRSFSSTPRSPNHHPPPSPLSPHFRSSHSLRRKGSVSSSSTQSTNASSRLIIGPRSTGNLYLSSLAERASTDTVADSRLTPSDDIDANDDDPEAADYESAVQELNGIRRRTEELDARYHSRLEYLKAKLKAAELRERVLRH